VSGFTWNPNTSTIEPYPFPTTPEGFSGGGVWGLIQPKAEELFVPARHIRLYAIQSAWYPGERRTKCVRIVHLLQLLHRDYPDLREHLANWFPELDQLA
jgi:hypothetical protein